MFFWWLQAILLNIYNIKISEGKYRYFKCNFNEKKNYAHSFDEKHVLLWCDKNETNDESFEFLFFSFIGLAIRQMSTFTFQPKSVFYRNLHYPIQDKLSLLISKSVPRNFADKLMATMTCLWCTLICPCTVTSRSSLM